MLLLRTVSSACLIMVALTWQMPQAEAKKRRLLMYDRGVKKHLKRNRYLAKFIIKDVSAG